MQNDMEAKLKHLEFIQGTINRMSNNSFLLKGWAVAIVGGLLALTFREMDGNYIGVAFAVVFFFWLLDSYYLSHERSFIRLYNHVRKLEATVTDFSMDPKPFRVAGGWWRCAFSTTILLFYGGLVAAGLLITNFL
jgi:hypothetical protein